MLFFLLVFLFPFDLDAQVPKLSGKDNTRYKQALKTIDIDVNKSLSDFIVLKNTNPLNIDVSFQVAECYFSLKKYAKAAYEYSWAESLIKNLLSNNEINKSQREKNKYLRILDVCKGRRQTCKVLEPPLLIDNDEIKEKEPDKAILPPAEPINHTNYNPECESVILDYADLDFIAFNSTEQVSQKKELKDHVIKLYNQNRTNLIEAEKNGRKLMCINQKWLKDNATTNYDWFEKFKNKEDLLFDAIQKYNEERNIRNRIENEKRTIESEINFLELQLQIDENNLKNTEFSIDKEIKEGMLNKLATIPQSIVMIGRMTIPSGENDEVINRKLTDKIDSLLKIIAIEKINGFTLQKTTLTYQDKLNSIFTKSLKGKARTTDTYYKRILRTTPDQEKFLYKIIRIEVNPYDTLTSSNNLTVSNSTGKLPSTGSSERFDAFILEKNCSIKQIISGGVENRIDIEDLKLYEDERSYISFLCSFSNDLNLKYESKVNEAAVQYDVELIKTNNKRDSIAGFIIQKKEEISFKRLQVIEKSNILASIQRLDSLKAELNRANEIYEATYGSKTTVTNQLSIESSAQVLQDEVLFGRLSDKCYRVIDDIKRNELMISVTQLNADQNQNYRNDRFNLRFEAIPIAYQVLSLNRIEVKEDEPTLFLNISFKIGYSKKESTPIFTSVVNTEIQNPESTGTGYSTHIGIEKKSSAGASQKQIINTIPTSGEFIINEAEKMMTENSTRTKWILFTDNPTSHRAFVSSNQNSEAVLPTLNELTEFFSKIAYQERNGNNFFSKLFSFDGETATFASSEKEQQGGNEQIKCLKIFLPDFKTQEEFLDEGEAVNIITLKRGY